MYIYIYIYIYILLLDPCDLNPCNGGTCTQYQGIVTCKCTIGNTGLRCQGMYIYIIY